MRVSQRNDRVEASMEGSNRAQRSSRSRAESALNYWQLRALAALRRKCDGYFSERSGLAQTLEADWIFGGADAMRGLRERATRLLNPANSV